MTSTIKLLSVIEATTVTGPAKNILNFSRLVHSPQFRQAELPRVEISIVTFHRSLTRDNGLRDDVGSASPNVFVAAARKEGIEVDVIRESFRFQPSIIRRLRAIVAQRRPDIIQTHMVKSHFLVKLAGLGKKYPWLAYHHGYTTTDLKMRAYNQLNRWSLPSATRVITVCDAFAKQLSRTGVRADRIVVCHNSVAAPRRVTNEEQQALKGKLAIAADERVVLAVGRLSREKGQRDLIDAGAVLNRMESALKFKLVIVGEGPERESLEQASREKGLNAQVLFVDHVQDVAPYYAIADALALPSHSEGSPNVLLEAMAAGVPVVATSVGGVPEIATDDESALLIPAHDPQLFATALRRILIDTDLAQTIGENAKARALHFSPESYARSLIRIYEEVVSGRQGDRACVTSQGHHRLQPRGDSTWT